MTPTGSTFVRVMRSDHGGWDVKEPGASRALCHAETQLEAARRAVHVLSPAGGQIRVLDAEGLLTRSIDVQPEAGPKRWWYLPHWRPFLLLSVLLLASGIINLVHDHLRLFMLLSALEVVVSAVVLVCALASRTRWRAAVRNAMGKIERELARP